ncbi:MAG: hypothetical protein ACFFG0_43930 [Candidatus Thorarchaeota archaeon]
MDNWDSKSDPVQDFMNAMEIIKKQKTPSVIYIFKDDESAKKFINGKIKLMEQENDQ